MRECPQKSSVDCKGSGYWAILSSVRPKGDQSGKEQRRASFTPGRSPRGWKGDYSISWVNKQLRQGDTRQGIRYLSSWLKDLARCRFLFEERKSKIDLERTACCHLDWLGVPSKFRSDQRHQCTLPPCPFKGFSSSSIVFSFAKTNELTARRKSGCTRSISFWARLLAIFSE